MPLLQKRYDTCNFESKQQYSEVKKVINLLGVLFELKMTWASQVEQNITKAKKALNAIKLIRRFFSSKELLQIITGNFSQFCFTTLKSGTFQN